MFTITNHKNTKTLICDTRWTIHFIIIKLVLVIWLVSNSYCVRHNRFQDCQIGYFEYKTRKIRISFSNRSCFYVLFEYITKCIILFFERFRYKKFKIPVEVLFVQCAKDRTRRPQRSTALQARQTE